MDLLGQTALGIIILLLLGMLVLVKRIATRDVLDKPQGNLLVQLGGSAPRSEDQMVMSGPYRLIRHPMYGAALSISLGLSLLIQSGAFLLVFCVYLVLVLLLIPLEEEGLLNAYGERYLAYQRRTRRLLLIPHGSL